MKILLVDDSPLSLMTFQRSLELLGYSDVRTTTCGQEGLQMVRQEAPDVIFSDMCMPGMSGLELIQHLRTEGFEMPVFILSASADLAIQRELRALGCPLILLKPIATASISRLLDYLKTQLIPAVAS